jgi:hypothetical protein
MLKDLLDDTIDKTKMNNIFCEDGEIKQLMFPNTTNPLPLLLNEK